MNLAPTPAFDEAPARAEAGARPLVCSQAPLQTEQASRAERYSPTALSTAGRRERMARKGFRRGDEVPSPSGRSIARGFAGPKGGPARRSSSQSQPRGAQAGRARGVVAQRERRPKPAPKRRARQRFPRQLRVSRSPPASPARRGGRRAVATAASASRMARPGRERCCYSGMRRWLREWPPAPSCCY
jgi:hypothetical protein